MSEETAIKVENVSKNFILPHEKTNSIKGAFTGIAKQKRKTKEVQHALRGISFEIKKGEFFGIVGRNGSGKSTLLKILADIYQPTKGKVSTAGKLVPFIELGVGFNPELTGRENVYLNGAMLGFSEKEIDSMYKDIVEFAELERFMDQKLKNYSSGMQVRLAFSMATRSEADILLVDEVLAVGDADFQRKCFDYFQALKKNKKTVVFVSHDMNAVREYCDRAVMIEKSEIVATGDPEEVAAEYSKLFMNKSPSEMPEGQSVTRSGDLSVQYTKVSISPKIVNKEKGIKITASAKVTKVVENPVFGFAIKNSAGQHIMGTNSAIKRKKIKQVNPGEVIDLVWDIPHIFGDGTYFVDFAIHYSGGTREADLWLEAASFKAYKEDRTPYIVSPDVTLQIEDSKTDGI